MGQLDDVGRRKAASLAALVYGDAYGALVEYWKPSEIRLVFGEYEALPPAVPAADIVAKIGAKRLGWVRPLGLHTDDGQQALALVRVAHGAFGWGASHRDHWRRLVVEGFRVGAWRGIGKMFLQAGERMKDPAVPHGRTGSVSAGIGAAMRIGPLGAAYADDAAALETAAVESTLMTHADLRAAATAFAVARAVGWLVNGVPVATVRKNLPGAVRAMEERWKTSADWSFERTEPHQVSKGLEQVLGEKPEPAALAETVRRVARAVSGVEAESANDPFCLYGGVYAIAMALADGAPRELLRQIIHQGADTDTVAAIAGSILGARHGTEWIPWDRLHDSERIARYAHALAVREALPEATDTVFLGVEAGLTRWSDGFAATLRP